MVKTKIEENVRRIKEEEENNKGEAYLVEMSLGLRKRGSRLRLGGVANKRNKLY